MCSARLKSSRVRLLPEAYRDLHLEILERDSWRCQICGSMQQLQVHHLQYRSHSGSDSDENLITLCARCHLGLHAGGTKGELI